MISTTSNERQVPPLPFSIENKKTDFLPFLSPREKNSGYAHVSPRVHMDPISDSSLQRTVEAVWSSILDKIQKPAPDQKKYILSIPYSQGLLFKELLWPHPTKVETSGKFTVILNKRLTKMERTSSNDNSPIYHTREELIYSSRIRPNEIDSNEESHSSIEKGNEESPSCEMTASQNTSILPSHDIASGKSKSSRSSSATNLRKRISRQSEEPDYLQKFLEISKLMLACKKEKKKGFTISSVGFDREFFKAALFYHYPNYICSIASKQKQSDPGLLQVTLQKGERDLEDLAHKIDRLESLVDLINHSTSQIFSPSLRYIESDPSPLAPKKEKRVFRAPSEQTETNRTYFRSPNLNADDFNLSSSSSLQEGIETDTFSKWELLLKSQHNHINWVVATLTNLIKDKFDGKVPKTTKSTWKSIWNSIEHPSDLQLNQEDIREIISLKCKLARASFKLNPYLNEKDEDNKLSKSDQMLLIEDHQIERSIYPQASGKPIASLFVNGKQLLSNPVDWTREVSLDYFNTLLTELLQAQHRYSPRKTTQLLAGLFNFTNLQIHPAPIQDPLILPMLKAATFGFGANAFWVLKSFFTQKDQYEILDTKNYTPTYEFFTDKLQNCKTIRTAAFTLWRVSSRSEPKEKLGVFVTKLISSFSSATQKWSFKVEIPNFKPSPFCSLQDQKKIHKKLCK